MLFHWNRSRIRARLVLSPSAPPFTRSLFNEVNYGVESLAYTVWSRKAKSEGRVLLFGVLTQDRGNPEKVPAFRWKDAFCAHSVLPLSPDVSLGCIFELLF